MPGKISEMAAQTAAGLVLTDDIETRDISDTSMAPTGTNKRMPWQEVINFLSAYLPQGYRYRYNANPASPPAAGEIRLNSTDLWSVDTIYIHYSDLSGPSRFKPALLMMEANTDIYISDANNPANCLIGRLTVYPNDQSTYARVFVTANNALGAFTDGSDVIVTILPGREALFATTSDGLVPNTSGVTGISRFDSTFLSAGRNWIIPAIIGYTYFYELGTTPPPTNSGYIKFNNAAISAATAAYLKNIDFAGNAEPGYVMSIMSAGQVMYVSDTNDENNWQAFTITSITNDAPNFSKTLGLTSINGAGTINTGTQVLVRFIPGSNAAPAAGAIAFTPYAFSQLHTISATNVQNAIQETVDDLPLYKIQFGATGSRWWWGFAGGFAGSNRITYLAPVGWDYGGLATRFGITVPVITGAMLPGINVVGSGIAANFVATGQLQPVRRVEYVAAAATNAVAGWVANGETVRTPTGSGNRNAIFSQFRFGICSGGANTSMRLFVGFVASSALPTDVEPSTLTSMFGVGFDSADAQLQWMSNDATGAATKVALGSSFVVPTSDYNNYYTLTIYAPCSPSTRELCYHITDISNGGSATGIINVSGDMPAADTAMYPTMWCSAGGVSSSPGIALCGFDVWTNS